MLAPYRSLAVLITEAEAKLDPLAKAKETVRRLRTIPAVGTRSAETVAAYLPDPSRFASSKLLIAYAGLVLRQYQSGELGSRGRITRRGPALLRKLLVECDGCMLRYNVWAHEVYGGLSWGKVRKNQAIMAVARKLLVRCWAMLRDGTAKGPGGDFLMQQLDSMGVGSTTVRETIDRVLKELESQRATRVSE